MNQKEWDRMIGQELYDPFNVHDDSFQRVHAAQRKFNASDDLPEKQFIAKKINDWLTACVEESGAFFLNTIEAGRPKSRPISFHMLKDGVNYFGVGAMKEVYRQMQENSYVEIYGLMGKGKLFFRYYGKAVFEQGDELAQEALAQPGYPVMKKIYTPESGNRFAVFHLEDATAEKRAMMSVLETWNL